MANIQIYTAGACSGNPGPGGYGAIALQDGKEIFRLSQGFRKTMNNRMEILAVARSLEVLLEKIDVDAIRRRETYLHVTVFSDSQLVVNTLNQGWTRNSNGKWRRVGPRREKTNKDLWKRLEEAAVDLDPYCFELVFDKVKEHSDDKYNNIADELAVHGRENFCNQVDEVYEKIAGKADEESLLAKPKVKEIRLLGYETPERRNVEVLLSNGTTVTILPCSGGFEQTGGTQQDYALTVDIAWRFVGYLNGKSL